MKRILADVDRCSGCRLCEIICSFSKEDAFASSTSRITVMKDDCVGLDLPIVCWHCSSCKAMENCPTEALEKNEEGLVSLKREKCIGCSKCVQACVIGAIKPHPESSIPLICDQCSGKPLCVQKCPTKALSYVDTEEQQPRLPDQIIKEALGKWGILA